jgi:hypothetical protein
MNGTVQIDESIAAQHGLKNGDVKQFRVSFGGTKRGGNAHQRRISRRLSIRKSVIVPMTIYIQPSNAKHTPNL